MAQPAKKQKRLTKYSLEYQKEYPFIKACSSSLKDHLYKFHCSLCNVNISCAHGGISDVREHIAIQATTKLLIAIVKVSLIRMVMLFLK